MRYFLVDDDLSVRTIIADIIEEENLGIIVGEASDGADISATMLNYNRVDILIIDLLMPNRDGLQTVFAIRPAYSGKIIMLSQIESKDLIGEAYYAGIDQYITKPVNKFEIITVLHKLNERILLEQSIQTIQSSLSFLTKQDTYSPTPIDEHSKEQLYLQNCKYCLNELGISSEHGYKDILEILHLIYLNDIENHEQSLTLKELYYQTAIKRFTKDDQIAKEVKSIEQRIRRAISQSLEHIAKLGLNDFSDVTFEQYASKLFDFVQVQNKIQELKGKKTLSHDCGKINIKKYLLGIYNELHAHN